MYLRLITILTFFLAVLIPTTAHTDSPPPAQTSDLVEAELIFLKGRTKTGEDIRAENALGFALSGQSAACANCHGKAGLGNGEGTVFTPPITGRHLTTGIEIGSKATRGFRTLREGYTPESFYRRITQAPTSPRGDASHIMPSEKFSRSQTDALFFYLAHKSLGTFQGVSDNQIRLATIVVEGYRPAAATAYLSVLKAFVTSKNAQTRNESIRKVNAPAYRAWKDQAYRDWKLDEWLLSGPPSQWATQLSRYHEQQEPFLVLGGWAPDWTSIHEFCEKSSLPCILPSTNAPVGATPSQNNLYFTRGLDLAADTLLDHVHSLDEPAPSSITQLYCDKPQQEVAERVANSLIATNIASPRHQCSKTFSQQVLPNEGEHWLVSWSAKGLKQLSNQTGFDRVFVAAVNTPLTEITNQDWLEGVSVIHDRALPEAINARFKYIRPWLRNYDLAVDEYKEEKLNALFTASLVRQTLKHVGSNFDRTYFLDRLEHVFDSILTPTAYPSVSLGPGQRFASRQAQIHSSADLAQRSEKNSSRQLTTPRLD